MEGNGSLSDLYYRPYTIDITDFKSNLCVLDPTILDPNKTYIDAPCSFCEAGNVLTFDSVDSSLECARCPDDQYSLKNTTFVPR